MRLKKSSFWSKIPNWVWVLISLAVAIAIWLFAAYTWPLVFATPKAVVDAFISKAASGVLWGHVWASLSRVLSGFAIAFVVSIPVAFLMAWYDPFRHVVEPWIQFIRNIHPGGGTCVVAVYEKHYYRAGNRLTLTVVLDDFTGRTRVHCISGGGGEGLFRFDWGAAESFEGVVHDALSHYRL